MASASKLLAVAKMIGTPASAISRNLHSSRQVRRLLDEPTPGFLRRSSVAIRCHSSAASPEGSQPADQGQQQKEQGAVSRRGPIGGAPTLRRGRGRVGLTSPLSTTFADLWDPFFHGGRDLRQMVDMVDRMFDDFLPSISQPGGALATVAPAVRTPWDFKETEEAFHMRVDMPGLSKEEVKVQIENGDTLVISGEHKQEKDDDLWASRSARTYKSRLVLPEHVKPEEIKAELKDGELRVSIPKKEKEVSTENVVTVAIQ